jgi:hypothetical protein
MTTQVQIKYLQCLTNLVVSSLHGLSYTLSYMHKYTKLATALPVKCYRAGEKRGICYYCKIEQVLNVCKTTKIKIARFTDW